MHGYVDIGLGKAWHTHFDSPVNNLTFNDRDNLILSLSPNEKFYKNNLFMELGLSWAQPFMKNSPYFPFVNVGLRYQVNNLNEQITSMGLHARSKDVDSDFQDIVGIAFLFNNPQEFIFSQNSLLMTFKLNLYRWRYLMPYINGGFGTTWHQVIQNNGLEKQTTNSALFNYLADYKKNKEFTYNVGLGVDFVVTENFWLSFGYQYNYYGNLSVNLNYIGINVDAVDKLKALKEDFLGQDSMKNLFFKPFQFNNLSTQTLQLTGHYVFG